MTKVAYVLSYKDPQYVRSTFLMNTIKEIEGVKLYSAINKHRSYYRYIETIFKLLALRITKRPDVYILGFRGIEIYWLVRLITIAKPLIFDDFVNSHLWLIEEHHKFKHRSFMEKLVRLYCKYAIKSSQLTLCDTESHAQYSIDKFSIDTDKFLAIYVGADENFFVSKNANENNSDTFNVFFYGNLLPLHGAKYIVEAANLLRDNDQIQFTIIGGANRKHDEQALIKQIKELRLSNVSHTTWASLDEIKEEIQNADLCLGGPFGNTVQARKVITGKSFQFLTMSKATVIGVNDTKSGFVDKLNCLEVAQGSSEDLAASIDWAYNNRDELLSIGIKGKELYDDRFSSTAQRKKLENAFKELVKSQ